MASVGILLAIVNTYLASMLQWLRYGPRLRRISQPVLGIRAKGASLRLSRGLKRDLVAVASANTASRGRFQMRARRPRSEQKVHLKYSNRGNTLCGIEGEPFTTDLDSASCLDCIHRWRAFWRRPVSLVFLGILGLFIPIIMCAVVLDRIDAPKRQAQDAEERRAGFHCLDKWDGNHLGLEDLVRLRLKDPGSMETFDTRIAPVGEDGQHSIIMDFGARNPLGGMVRYTALGRVHPTTCKATLIDLWPSG